MIPSPMDWSIYGAEKMARLKAYHLNGGNMLELVRYQERALPKADGAEELYITSRELLNLEKNRHRQMEKYMKNISHSISLKVKKVHFNTHIIYRDYDKEKSIK